MKKLTVNIKDLHDFYSAGGTASVRTAKGELTKIKETVKKINVDCVEVDLGTHKRKVAATHRFAHNGSEVYAKDATFIDTAGGKIPVSVKPIDKSDVYDIMIAEPHWYQDQYGVIHHNTGKSMGMISLASDYIEMGKNVLYISMEMSEEMCSKRIDANLLDITLDELDSDDLAYSTYKRKIEKIREKGTYGNLYVKAYGTGTANANNFRSLINELKLKKNFKPDVIFIDYLGICGSVRIKQFTENSYTLVKTIAEELRALAFEFNIPIWSAAQTTRGGWDSSDLSMSDVAESAGLVATCDFMLAIIETTELAEINQQMIKQLKSRYGDKYYINKFNIKVKKGNQKWIEMDPSEQRGDVAQNSLAQQMQANSKKLAPPSTVKSKIDNLIGDLQSDLTQQDLEPDKPKPVKDKPKPTPIKKSDSIKDEFSDEDTSDGGFKVRERKTVNLKNVNFS